MSLSIESVSHGYRRHPVLHGVSFGAPAGSFVGLLGPNGSGKSTLTKLIAGVSRPQSGAIRWNGTDLARLGRRAHARIVAFVPQSAPSPFELSVREAVLLGRTPHFDFRPGPEDWAAVDDAIAQLGLEALSQRRVSELSGGQAQRVLIARAIAQQPQLLLLDEPTSALDLRYQIETLTLVRSITRRNGVTALIAIHDLNQAARFCDQVVLLCDGRVQAAGTPAQAFAAETISRVYGLEVDVHRDGARIEVRPRLDHVPWPEGRT